MDNRTPLHTAAAHDAITAELVACTLGQRQRLELRVDPAGKIQNALRSGLLAIAPSFDRLVAELRAYRYHGGTR